MSSGFASLETKVLDNENPSIQEIKESIIDAYLKKWGDEKGITSSKDQLLAQKDELLCETADTINMSLFLGYDELDIKMLADELATLDEKTQVDLDRLQACILEGVEVAFPLVIGKAVEYKKLAVKANALKKEIARIDEAENTLRESLGIKKEDPIKLPDDLAEELPFVTDKVESKEKIEYFFPVQGYDKVTRGIHSEGYDKSGTYCKGHYGFDIATKYPNLNPPILAACTGTVFNVGGNVSPYTDYGNHIVLKVGDYLVMYGHLSFVPVFTKGTLIKAGTTIGKVGHTGNSIGIPGVSLGDHLHFEVRKGTDWASASFVNPSTAFPEVWLPKAITASANLSADATKNVK